MNLSIINMDQLRLATVQEFSNYRLYKSEDERMLMSDVDLKKIWEKYFEK